MSKPDDRKKQPLLPKTNEDFDEQLRMRRELGIEGLPDGQELMNTATFSRVQLDALLKTKRIAEEAEPAALEQSSEILLEEIATELPTRERGPAAENEPPADPVALAGLEQEMMKAKSRDEVAEHAVRVAAYHARSAALFVVHKGIVAGLRSAGDGLPAGVDAVMIPANSESVLCRPIETGKPCRSGRPLGEVDERVLRAMGRFDARELIVLPVRVADSVVGVLYADNGEAPLADTSIGALRVLAAGVGKAYERLAETTHPGGV